MTILRSVCLACLLLSTLVIGVGCKANNAADPPATKKAAGTAKAAVPATKAVDK